MGDTMNQLKTPLYQALKEHIKINPISLHVPGHKNGELLKGEPLFQQVLKMDVTELSNLDDLHSPEGAIREAERLLADAYKAERSFFLINGSTVGNLAMIMAALQEGDIAFIQRNSHKSVLNGIELTKAQPILLGPDYVEGWDVAGGVSLETVKEAYSLYPNCKAIILTYPNYYGMTYELKEIIDFAHRKQIPVLVDEAHGAHFIGGEVFPPSAIELGADVVVQSAHKTLPAMTMGSFLHVNSEHISIETVNHFLRILQSSSPSYPIMASLDLARRYISTYTIEDQEYLRKAIELFRNELTALKQIKVLEFPNGIGDVLKLTLQSQCGYSGYELQSLLEKRGVYTEMADPKNVLLVLPLLKRDMPFFFDEIIKRIKEALSNITTREIYSSSFTYFKKAAVSTISTYENQSIKELPITEATNYLCGETIIPYPPGIPLLLPGEKITDEDIQGLISLMRSGARFQGGEGLKEGKIKVFLQNGG